MASWFGVVFGLFGSFFVYLFFPWGFWNDWRLESDTVQVGAGRIISAAPINLTINDEKVWRYLFEYSPAPANVARAECYTTGQRWHPQDSVQVRYSPGGPAVVVGARTTEAGGSGVFVALLPVFGFGMAYYSFRQRRTLRAVLREGRLIRARVTAVEKTAVQVNYQYVYKVYFQTPDAIAPEPLVLRCSQPALVALAETKFQSGEAVDVLFHSDYPKQVVFLESL